MPADKLNDEINAAELAAARASVDLREALEAVTELKRKRNEAFPNQKLVFVDRGPSANLCPFCKSFYAPRPEDLGPHQDRNCRPFKKRKRRLVGGMEAV